MASTQYQEHVGGLRYQFTQTFPALQYCCSTQSTESHRHMIMLKFQVTQLGSFLDILIHSCNEEVSGYNDFQMLFFADGTIFLAKTKHTVMMRHLRIHAINSYRCKYQPVQKPATGTEQPCSKNTMVLS